MRILEISNPKALRQVMQEIKVDPYGIGIMLPKAGFRLVRLEAVSNITANILKQEMLSLGGDAAVARDCLTGKTKKTGCLLMGSLAQFNGLKEKLNRQPFGLDKLAQELNHVLANYQQEKFVLDLGRFKLRLQDGSACIMGIVNMTPDSFSGDGFYKVSGVRCQVSGAIEFAQQMVRDGAQIIDVGGESSRPGAKPVSVKEEIRRTIPLIKALAKKIKVPISIDTYKSEVAKQALDNGAVMVNDITALRDAKLAKMISRYRAGVVLMHMLGRPQTMQKNPRYISLQDEIAGYLEKAIVRAQEAGIGKDKIIIDPGLGFGKTLEHNLGILRNLREFKTLGRPLMVGPSRKSFLGKILNVGPHDRVSGTVAACVIAVENGANIVRVHDVKEVSQGLRIVKAAQGR